ncbi:MAG: iron hydrogenase, partial [Mailhella sp.]|nr:iron hydrogenase [Mailhella sp.]
SGMRDIDATINTRELAYLIKKAGIDLSRLPEATEYDNLMGEGTGAATIFGVTGGVMEAALRFAYEAVVGKKPGKWDFHPVRGMEGFREATINVGGVDVKVAVVHGAKNFPAVLNQVRAGKSPYHFIEFMACPGGCVCGGGQPIMPTVWDVFERKTGQLFADFRQRLEDAQA